MLSRALQRLEAALVSVNRWVLIALLAAMAMIIFANVVLRYTTGDSLIWAEEVARHLMIWGTFLGAGLVLRFGGHVAIDNFHQAIGTRSGQAVRVFIVLAIAVFCVVMVWHSIAYTRIMRFQTTPATGISFAYVYAAIPVGFSLLLVHLAFVVRGYVAGGRHLDSPELDAESAASL
jgi:TRAP-type C4-dicarboxylate transport system permease small subunit